MGASEFVLNVLASWLANKIDSLFGIEQIDNKQEKLSEMKKIEDTKEDKRQFQTFDIFHDIDEILSDIENPIGHLIIEKEPSTFYRLTCFVLESTVTGEWYVFRRGRMSFESTHGGWLQTQSLLDKLKNKKVLITLWSIDNEILNKFEKGLILWSEVKNKLIPLRASLNNSDEWECLKNRAQELVKKFKF